MYVQETGRAGQDGALLCILLLDGRGDLGKKRTSEVMINYCINPDEDCRFFFLILIGKNIESRRCCYDVCIKDCSCKQCEQNTQNFYPARMRKG